MAWSFGFKKVPSIYEHLGQSWKFDAGIDKVEVTFKFFNWQGGDSCQDGPLDSSAACTVTRKYKVPISSLKSMGARVPRNEIEAQALTREFNGKVQFVSKGQSINGTNSSDFLMKWRDLYE